jgi:predicted RNA-binding protein with PIN domain
MYKSSWPCDTIKPLRIAAMIIIDAYNCLHAGSSMPGPWRGFSLRELCRLLERVDKKIVLVMDGSPKPHEPATEEFPDIKLVYSGRGRSADAVIIAMVNASTGARHITVISNDRAVKAGAHRGGARTMGCEKYLAGILRRKAAMRMRWKTAEPEGKSTGHSAETDYWLHEFGFAPRGAKTKSAQRPGQKVFHATSGELNIDEIDMEEILRTTTPRDK